MSDYLILRGILGVVFFLKRLKYVVIGKSSYGICFVCGHGLQIRAIGFFCNGLKPVVTDISSLRDYGLDVARKLGDFAEKV